MKTTKSAIIGYGVVGKAQEQFLGKENCVIYDPFAGFNDKKKINDECLISFICVPTPMNEDGSCNTDIVEESVKWVTTPIIVIRSTVTPGTTELLSKKYKKNIIFQPEYLGETAHHPYADKDNKDFIILGGNKKDCLKVSQLLQRRVPQTVRFYFTDSKTAELCKYMENSFLATKVIFCNEFYEMANLLGVNYNELRELWLADSRIGKTHTFVYPEERGFGGKCLPKDVSGIYVKMKQNGYEPKLIKAVLEANQDFTNKNKSLKK